MRHQEATQKMSVIKLFSVREKEKERAGQPDVYQYDTLPKPLLVQIVHIWRDAVGPFTYENSPQNEIWDGIHDTLAREKGIFHLSRTHNGNPYEACQDYLLNAEVLDALDLIELAFVFINSDGAQRILNAPRFGYNPTRTPPDEATQELNERFRAHGVGYQFLEGQIIRIDSQYVHAEAVRPALSLLQATGFEGPSEEFLKAHEHYRHGRMKEAIAEALKAFESTMKAIIAGRGWPLKGTETASQLLTIVFDNGLIPPYLSSQFTALKAVLEAGLPTVRNKTSGHGQGATPTTIPDYLAAYALHLAASNIVLLIEAHKSTP